MKRQFLFVLIFVNFITLMNVNNLHGQIMEWGEYGVDSTNLKLVRTDGLHEIDLVEQDSGRPEYKTFEQFSKTGDSIWDYSEYQNRFDSGSRRMLFDSRNKLLFESDIHNNSFFFQGSQSYYYSYDSLRRIIKKSHLSSVDNQLTTDILSYNSRGDTVVTWDYDEEGKLFQIDTNIYDRYGNELTWRQKHVGFPEWPESEIGHNIYDIRGRLIARSSMPSIKPTRIVYPFMEKKVYVDSPGVENNWDYRWGDTSWSKFPDEHGRMDSIKLQRVTERFDSSGTLISTEVIDYKSIKRALHIRYDKPKENLIEDETFTYGRHDRLTSENIFHNNRLVKTRTYTYIYSK
jgi:hypothetical protein